MITKFDLAMLKAAVRLSKSCPTSMKAYSVGAIIVDSYNNIIATGYSRETSDNAHAEEVAIYKALNLGMCLENKIIYSTMEPCGCRLSGIQSCAEKIIETGINRVIYGIKEPFFLIDEPTGINKLVEKNIIVDEIPEYNQEIIEINKHIYW